MCTKRSLVWSLLVLSVVNIGLGVSSITLAVLGIRRTLWVQKSQTSYSTPIWCGVCFVICGVCGILCAKKRTGFTMILFSASCICGLIGGILTVQFVRAMVKQVNNLHSLHLALLCLAVLGILGCTLSTWLTCRLASYEQKRLYLERDLSLHHSVEMNEKMKSPCGSQ